VRRRPDRSWGEPLERVASGFWPVWSPDGGRLAYGSSMTGGAISIVPVDSGPPRVLMDPARSGGLLGETPLWSADGKSVFFRSHDSRGNASIWAIPAAGGTPKRLVTFDDPSHPSYRSQFAISGGRIYFISEDRQADVYVMEVVRR
jgi:Tol biopolymer transport system component